MSETSPFIATQYLRGSGSAIVSTPDVIDTAINVISTAKRKFKCTHVAELPEKKRDEMLAAIHQVLEALGIDEIVVEWREQRQDERA